MELFSEIYGCYYAITAQILRAAPLPREAIQKLVAQKGYGESGLHLAPKLLDPSAWALLREDHGVYRSCVQPLPERPLSLLEKSWLKALLADPRIRLFLSDAQLTHAETALADTEPLFLPGDILYFDQYADGDPYTDADYRSRFRQILTAMEAGLFLRLTYQAPRQGSLTGDFRPLRLEYSAKDDKFRVYLAKVSRGEFQCFVTFNLSRLLCAAPSSESCPIPYSLDDWRKRRRVSEPAVLRVTAERNGIERFMVEFSSYEKQSVYEPETKSCLVTLWYQRDDETEIVIRLLSFGPVVQVLSPSRLVRLLRARILRQYAQYPPK